jgi:hypothetical protein
VSRYLGSCGSYDLASTLAEQALGLRERVLGKDHTDTLTSLSNLTGILCNQGKYGEAEEMYRRTVELRRRCWAQSTETR